MPVYNQSRKNVIRLIMIVVMAVIGMRLFYLQIIEKKYNVLARQQAIQRKIVYPSRGIIYDRNGRTLVNNTVLYDLMVTPADVRKMDTAYFCQLLQIDTAEFRLRLQRAITRNGWVRPSVFAPLLPPDVYGRMEENVYQFPGFDLVARPVRNYPYNAGAHIFGMIGEVDSAIIKRSNYFYQSGDYTGMTGLEKSYEPVLMGQRGVSYIVRDVRNRPQGPYDGGIYDTAAIAGKNLHLALDIDLQSLGEKLMQNKIGSIVAIDPQTGGILTMVSSPDFNPNLLTGSDRTKNYASLLRDPAKPLFNRAIMAQYPPGSTFKPLDALVVLDQHLITPSFGVACLGAYYGCGRVIKCTEHWAGHAKDLLTAIAWSCNSYFSVVFRKIIDADGKPSDGLMKWKSYMSAFGLGHRLGIDLPGESPGYIPDTTHYNKIFGKNHWNSCTIVSCGIGQGEVLETPLQIANAMCLIGNHGYYYTPHLVQSIEGDSSMLRLYHVRHETTHLSESDYEIVVNAMAQVVEQGTARSARIPGIEMCGKTGTAENYAMINGKRTKLKDHSIFAAFAPKDHPRIAICVVVENSGYGATYAAPIASLMVEKYLKDSIASGPRTVMMQSLINTNLIPGYIIDAERQVQHREDSIKRVRQAEALRSKAFAVSNKEKR